MTFRRGARLNPGQLRDLRGMGGGGRRIGLPGGGFGGRGGGGGGFGLPVGGGIGSIVLLLVVVGIMFFLNGGLGGGTTTNPGVGQGGGAGQPGPVGTGLAHCQTGEDANQYQDCRIVGFVNSIQAYWTQEYAQSGTAYRQGQTTLFSDAVETACGQASSSTGPFYCPADQNIYIDLSFYDVLESQFGSASGPLAQAYVMAHEYGHHVQNLEGTLAQMNDGQTGPTSNGVRLELQADCYAGVWAGNAVQTGYLEPITQDQINEALSAAAAVGDDRIQQTTQGRVSPEKFTHGSSEQRTRWFETGYRAADPAACDTFNTNQL